VDNGSFRRRKKTKGKALAVGDLRDAERDANFLTAAELASSNSYPKG
jgi:hypothetical protein